MLTDWDELQRGDTVVLNNGEEVICGTAHNYSFRGINTNSSIAYDDCKGYYPYAERDFQQERDKIDLTYD